tara:strand:- start:506 stop:703 length:198 start_codon:yes stop_codon:yes gene_type:complete
MTGAIKNNKEDQNQVVVSKTFGGSMGIFSTASKQTSIMKSFLNDVKNSSFSQSVNSFKSALSKLK